MINKKLLNFVPESKKYIFLSVLFQWISMVLNTTLIFGTALFLQKIYENDLKDKYVLYLAALFLCVIIFRHLFNIQIGKYSYFASKDIKKKLREKLFIKIGELENSYSDEISTSEIVQLSTEGVEQLENYFGGYLPQFFYSMLAPLTLFLIILPISLKAALVLLFCVPLIPILIALVQTFAKKLLNRYWKQYTKMGSSFLENLQGLTTLKIYKSDEYKHRQMNEEAELFRKITMKVLYMQLNSIAIMDLIAYGGSVIGIIISATEFSKGNISFAGAFIIIMLSAEFFIPMRQLGSFFHIAMNGISASNKLFTFLETKPQSTGDKSMEKEVDGFVCRDLTYSYEEGRNVLKDINLDISKGKITAIVGESGSGKSTIASILNGKLKNYEGSIRLGDYELKDIKTEDIKRKITYIGFGSYIFKGNIRDNLLMAGDFSDEKLWEALEKADLKDFLTEREGLDTELLERGSNFSGGQKQRLALARALLHDSEVYIFDEATSNIDAESENSIMSVIYDMPEDKSILLISHRLGNVVNADLIYVLKDGSIEESGTHKELIEKDGIYKKLFEKQRKLENIGGGVLYE